VAIAHNHFRQYIQPIKQRKKFIEEDLKKLNKSKKTIAQEGWIEIDEVPIKCEIQEMLSFSLLFTKFKCIESCRNVQTLVELNCS
jgi:vacuolar-type H+-ATPase subunit I/STV1